MRILIAEDDYASRKFLSQFLSQYGECDLTVDGIEAVDAFVIAHDMNKLYDLVCLDVMMPRIDGIKALKAIRDFEKKKGINGQKAVKIIMVSALNESEVVMESFSTGNEIYITKPIDLEKLVDSLKKFNLIS